MRLHMNSKACIVFERETAVDVWYDGVRVGHFRADFLVQGRVIVEAKAAEVLVAADREQSLNYLRGSMLEVGLLLHFGPRPQFHRLIHTNDRKASLPRIADQSP
jgi:GxxExxY protein